ncbi:uncharacterized protein N7479_000584 [Penicillium vulpinum]|uniref:Uncharacterized protein n=1 Tax=Penicillium vulpinum TaxID=29845 RepID=A0A1V6S5E1_9EURO|nr:uncharacterized protein N7479_000584 [Penicillium vulpinum]KAJ5970666.1 hypothetical protein N7479_000584 [Penicillium vulpinum]OQE09255.1 hypothetical protein PENVUL_c007G04353 [Penicillium vulpinum]
MPSSNMDSGATELSSHACFQARMQTHIKNQDSNSSSMSHNTMAMAEHIPSPRRWSPTYIPRRRSRHMPSLSFATSPVMPRIESPDFSTSQSRRPTDRAPGCVSPFRSVRKMKEPFQLMLPSSPASLDGPTSNFSEKLNRPPRTPADHILRTWRSDQNLTCSSLEGFGLLPSPPITESRPASAGPELSYFDCQSSDESRPSSVGGSEKVDPDATKPEVALTAATLEVGERIQYTAYRPPDWKNKPRTGVMNVHEAHSEFVRQCESGREQVPEAQPPIKPAIPTSIHSPRVFVPGSSPRPQRPRTGTVSSEASWVPSNFSYCERWLQGVPVDKVNDRNSSTKEPNNRRKFQIVENDPPMPKLDIIPGAKALEEPVRFVVASKTKPKLVDIARQSSPSLPLLPPLSLLPHTIPATPDQRQEEVSAFSPDTPLNLSGSGYRTRDFDYSFISYDDSTVDDDDDDAYTDPGSLTSSDSVGSTVICERPESAQGKRETSLQPEIRSGSVSPKASSPPRTNSPGRPAMMSINEDEKPRLWHPNWTLDDHEWTLDELEHSVKDFPRYVLRLASPVMVFLRKNDEKTLLKPFRTIFPDVSEHLLDCLCAALLARNYILSLSTIERTQSTVSPLKDTFAIDGVPKKAYNTLGIQFPSGSAHMSHDHIFSSCPARLQEQLDRNVDNLLFAICGRADPTLRSAVEVLAQVLETNA